MVDGITLEQIAASGRRIVVQCSACPNRRLLAATELGVPLSMLVTQAGALLRCSVCGGGSPLTFPESFRDLRKGRER
jgi:hypothetical protein